jgi:hypothetical protein
VTETLPNLAMAKKLSVFKFITKYFFAKTPKTLGTTGLLASQIQFCHPRSSDQTGFTKAHYNDAIASGNAFVRNLSKNIQKKMCGKRRLPVV